MLTLEELVRFVAKNCTGESTDEQIAAALRQRTWVPADLLRVLLAAIKADYSLGGIYVGRQTLRGALNRCSRRDNAQIMRLTVAVIKEKL